MEQSSTGTAVLGRRPLRRPLSTALGAMLTLGVGAILGGLLVAGTVAANAAPMSMVGSATGGMGGEHHGRRGQLLVVIDRSGTAEVAWDARAPVPWLPRLPRLPLAVLKSACAGVSVGWGRE